MKAAWKAKADAALERSRFDKCPGAYVVDVFQVTSIAVVNGDERPV